MGGLSNSKIWCIQTSLSQSFCLKAWPDNSLDADRLLELHRFIAQLNQRIDFIPTTIAPPLMPSVSFVHDAGFYWELNTWLAGRSLSPNQGELAHGKAAVHAIWQMHEASSSWRSEVGSSPAVAARLEKLRSFSDRLPALWSSLDQASPYGRLSQLTLRHFQRSANVLLEKLSQLTSPQKLIWVVRDLHCEHVLFRDTAVTGVVDFGAARVDEALIDLVRFLGSLWPCDREVRHQLVDLYASLSGQSGLLARFKVLDHASALLSAMQWLQWLVVERRGFYAEQQQLLDRWRLLNQRLDCDQW